MTCSGLEQLGPQAHLGAVLQHLGEISGCLGSEAPACLIRFDVVAGLSRDGHVCLLRDMLWWPIAAAL